ncbi:MurR/RpiR family transcriptional regulator [Vagococcus intermedius]|uniref:MurR/RpiR family transcriptional regulator n=1 Tax=Vagococcus intermedius TaxID=2991418 RepID=A0AAF0CV19_9ENTE|nr:MurR/RpiR family transcriptional regulator [Vagococcus intermedius]WEG73479.1 MurR/RpiR family transcriptional regulator [Vagococcus intermedius]WEG75562.1 MurR/RpiR family transcriptional regulator [Vagococcus intermedius]
MGLNDLINTHFDELSDTDKYICEFILDQRKKVGDMSIKEFSQLSLTSKSSVIRFAQKLGFTGYSELRNFIKWESQDGGEARGSHHFLNQVLSDTEKLIESIRKEDWLSIYKKIELSQRIFVITTGVTQQNQALELQRQLLLTGKNVSLIPGNPKSSEFKRMLEQLGESDMIFVLSLSGENTDLEGVINILNLKKSFLVSITNYKSNWLSKNSTYSLYARSSKSPDLTDWWLQTTSTFFVLIESFIFGYNDYLRGNYHVGES